MSHDVLPGAAMNDVAYRRASEPEFVCDGGLGFLRTVPFSDIPDDRIGERRKTITFATSPAFGVSTGPAAISASDSVRESPRPVIHPSGSTAPTLLCHIASIRRGIAEKEMIKSHAGRIVALMKDERGLAGYVRDGHPRPSMREHPSTSLAEFSVPLSSQGRRPYPTRPKVRHVFRHRAVLVDLGPETVRDTLTLSHAEPPRKVRGLGSGKRLKRDSGPPSFYHENSRRGR